MLPPSSSSISSLQPLLLKKLPQYTAEKYFLVSELEQAASTDIICSEDLSELDRDRSPRIIDSSPDDCIVIYDLLLFYFIWDIENTDVGAFVREVEHDLTLAIEKRGLLTTENNHNKTRQNSNNISSSISSSNSNSNNGGSESHVDRRRPIGRVVISVDCFDSRLKLGYTSVADLPSAAAISEACSRIQRHGYRLLGQGRRSLVHYDGGVSFDGSIINDDSIDNNSSSSSSNNDDKDSYINNDKNIAKDKNCKDSANNNRVGSNVFILTAVGNNKKASSALESISDLCRSSATDAISKAVIVRNRDCFIGLPVTNATKAVASSKEVKTEAEEDASNNIELMEPHGASNVVQYMIVPSSIGANDHDVVEGNDNDNDNDDTSNSSGLSSPPLGFGPDYSPYLELPLLTWVLLSRPNNNWDSNRDRTLEATIPRESPYKDDDKGFIGSMLVVIIAILIPLSIWHFNWIS